MRQNELNRAVHSALQDTVENQFDSKTYSVSSNDEFIADFMEALLVQINSNCTIKVNVLDEDKLHGLAENLGTDLYIMPSSLHEVIAVSASMGDPNELAQMVAEINMDQVALDERLSNQVYHYDKDLRRLSLATDTPNKRLDRIVEEPKLIYDSKSQSR